MSVKENTNVLTQQRCFYKYNHVCSALSDFYVINPKSLTYQSFLGTPSSPYLHQSDPTINNKNETMVPKMAVVPSPSDMGAISNVFVILFVHKTILFTHHVKVTIVTWTSDRWILELRKQRFFSKSSIFVLIKGLQFSDWYLQKTCTICQWLCHIDQSLTYNKNILTSLFLMGYTIV